MGEIILKHGGYQRLLSFQKARVVLDGTVIFCERFLSKRDRTVDQMVQAARSGKQNILEGSQASGTSKETELKLTGVARSSLEELLEDYRDYLRKQRLEAWSKDSREAQFARQRARLLDGSGRTEQEFLDYFRTRPAGIVANIQICLVHQVCYLLDRQMLSLEAAFTAQGGLRERMTQARRSHRSH